MNKIRRILIAVSLVAGILAASAPAANAVVCHDYPGGCCDSTLARKLGIYC